MSNMAKVLRLKLSTLHDTMETIGAADMAELSMSEAALFHVATQAIGHLCDSMDEWVETGPET